MYEMMTIISGYLSVNEQGTNVVMLNILTVGYMIPLGI